MGLLERRMAENGPTCHADPTPWRGGAEWLAVPHPNQQPPTFVKSGGWILVDDVIKFHLVYTHRHPIPPILEGRNSPVYFRMCVRLLL